jgi:hypothetical protein
VVIKRTAGCRRLSKYYLKTVAAAASKKGIYKAENEPGIPLFVSVSIFLYGDRHIYTDYNERKTVFFGGA